MRKSIPFLLLLFIQIFMAYGQNGDKAMPKNKWFFASDTIKIFEDFTRELTFEDIREKKFTSIEKVSPNVQSRYWYKFFIIDKLETDTILLRFINHDKSEVFIPTKNGYQKYKVGIISKTNFKVRDKAEKFVLKVPTKILDKSKPVYCSRVMITTWGRINKLGKPDIMHLENKDSYYQWLEGFTNEKNDYIFYLGVTAMSFLLFFVGFIVNKSRPFLLYSLYLLTLVIYYANRLPFTVNLWNQIDPDIYYYINQAMRLATTISYYIFIYYFLDVPNRFKTLYKFFKGVVYTMIIYSVFYLIIIIFFPLFVFRYEMIDYFFLLSTLTSITLFILMLTKKPDMVAIITLTGSLLITLGGIVAIYTVDALFLLKAVLVETVIFFGVISYQNRIKESKALKSLVQLNQEKQEKQSLKQLDELKSRFFENISHEFRTPLTLIKAPIDHALQNDAPLMEKDIRMIENNTYRLTTLINDMLSLSKLESRTMSLKLEHRNIRRHLQRIVSQYFSYAKSENISFKTQLISDNIIAEYDAEILERVLGNLISNAFKFTNNNGQVTVRTTIDGSDLKLEVKDNGIGISPDEQEKVFDRFYQINGKDENRPGSGIGLAMVKELVTLHGGTIQLKSAVQEGSLFSVTIPLRSITVDTEENEEMLTQSFRKKEKDVAVNHISNTSNGKRPLVLIAEDNKELREFLREKLSGIYRTKTAENGEAGITLALSKIPDIIISDVMMPKVNGIELCRTLKNNKKTAHIPIILLTAKAAEKDELIGLGTGADDYITKPFNLKKLMLVMDQRLKLRRILIDKYQKETLFQVNPDKLLTVEQEFLSKMRSILEVKLTDSNFKVQQLCDEMGMSRMQLNRKMKEILQDTPSNFLRNERLTLSILLLKDDKLSISEIAYSSGFSSPSHFIKCFKEKYKKTPLEYLQNIDNQ
ncbi:ATP-binding protein [Costertonia aggregata]|uniref:histidine kinase n=1 Tax=Costertonia aggregata TaxID=343403 RepID=A0A7H9ANA7_9FLAO|nr:ATP-binding protein [Costertonia aggregata]QLG44926.1 response regulator [Costertonia aggregata]